MTKYYNARDILPGPLLHEVQRYVHGNIYVPVPAKQSARNRARVLALRGQGLGTREIARRLRLTQRCVQKILRRERNSWQQVQRIPGESR